MGSFLRNVPQTTCSRLPLPLPLWLSPSLAPPLTVPPLRLPTRKRSSPPSLSPTSMESTTTTARPISRRQRLRTLTAVAGSYVIALPDGRIQTTKYTADHVNGFVAEVSYEGTPVYPPEPAEGYGHAAPVAAYAPAPPVYKPSA